MQLDLEPPDYRYVLRGVGADGVVVNEHVLTASFLMTPDSLEEHWRPRSADELRPEDFETVLALDPELIVLGTGARQRFPPAVAMAACLSRGVGLEVMDSAAACRTFNVLASEGRRVVGAFLLPGEPHL